jgi:hypothetical protein
VHVISIGLGLAAGASWALASTMKPQIEPAIDPGIARALVAADAGTHWTAVEARCAQLAAMPRLAAAVATDAATVRDMAAEEDAFRVVPRESVELGQVHTGGRAVSLLRVPESAPAMPLARLGRWLSVEGRDLRFTAITSIVPSQDANLMRGALAVSRTASPEVALRHLAERTPGRIVVDGAPVDIAGGLPEGTASIEVLLDELPGAPRLILPAAVTTPPLALGLRGLALASLLAGLAVAVAGRRRSRGPRATARGLAVGAPAPASPTAATAAATPPPASAPVAAATAPVSAPITASAPASAPIAALMNPDAAPGPGPAAATRRMSAATIPSRLGPYEPLALIGEGGTSSVYRARATGLDHAVAVKVLRRHLAYDERQRTMFLDEARVVSAIDHPNVIQIFDVGHTDDLIYIAMEHIDGEDLESLLARVRVEGRRVPLDLAVALLRQICAGLHAAHTAADAEGRPLRVVHRDVKPGNVLVSRDGNVKVSDFGIAKARQALHTSLIGEARGTAAFMAPEQRLGQLVDARTDVFGVAAIGFELITSLEIDLDLARLAKFGTAGWPHLPAPRQVRPEVPAALEAILLRGLAYAAADRPASCAELEAELARIADEAGWTAGELELGAWVEAEIARRPRPASRRQPIE